MLKNNIRNQKYNKLRYSVILVIFFTGLVILSSNIPLILNRSNEDGNEENFELIVTKRSDLINDQNLNLPSGSLNAKVTDFTLPYWTFRKYHTIMPAAGAGTNYQVKFNVHYGSGTDSGGDVYLNGHCQTDFDDIRFTSSNGITELDYWIEEIHPGDNATIWVEVAADLSVSSQTIYLYYGNSEASTASNGTNTFIRWDDFDFGYSTGDLPKASRGWHRWGTENSSNYIEIDTDPADGSNLVVRLEESGDSVGNYLQSNFSIPYTSVAVHLRERREQDRSIYQYFGNESENLVAVYLERISDEKWQYHPGVPPYIDFSPACPYEPEFNWFELEWRVNMTDFCVYHYADNQLHVGGFRQPPTDGFTQWYARNLATQPGTVFFDDFFIRKWVYPEPALGTWGPQEDLSTTGEFSLPDWDYRKNHTIMPAAGAGTNYQVMFNVHYGSGTDSGGDVYLNGHCQTDFDDIRFTSSDGITELDYWIAEIHSGDNATIWVEVAADLSSSSQTICLYYGNLGVSTTSNGTNTFIRWDDFNLGYIDGDLPKTSRGWHRTGTENSNNYIEIDTDSVDGSNLVVRLEESGDSVSNFLQNNFSVPYTSVAVHLRERREQDRSFYQYFSNETDNLAIVYLERISDEKWQYHPGVPPYIDFSPACPYEPEFNWFELEWRVNMTDFCVYHYADNQLHVGGFTETPTDGFTRWFARNLATQQGTVFFDDFFVRKWVYLEPVLGAWGLQENLLPTIDSPSDVFYEVGATGNTISWTPTDDDPSSYNITRDGSLVRDRAWNMSGETITIGVDGLSAGTYVYRCTVYDSAGRDAFDEVSIIVSTTNSPPAIDTPSDVFYEVGATGNTISWTPTDDDPSSYNITQDGSLVRDRAWNTSGETITIGVDGLSAGTYVYRCTVYDSAGQSAFDKVSVTVVSSVPTINFPSDISYEEGATGQSITWTPLDDDPASYNITRDCSLLRDRAWNMSGETITIGVDGLIEGTYVYRCTVYDSAGQNAFDEVTVTVLASGRVPSPPLNLTATSSSNLVTLTWNLPSDSGSSEIVEYRVYRSTYAGHYNFRGSTTSLEFIDNTVSNGMTYYYVVTAVNAHGESDYSEEISVIPLALTSESTETTSSTIESPQVTNGFLFSMIILPITILIFFRKRRNQR